MLSPTPTPKKLSPTHTTPTTSVGISADGSTTSAKRESAFSRRRSKPNPLMHRDGEEGRETRRKLFLKKVKEGSEEKRWQKRGGDDEMMRTIFMLEQRRETERRRREAAMEEMSGFEELEIQDEVEVDFDAVRREEEELEVLMREREHEMDLAGDRETLYGSDDEDYDDLFMDVIKEEMRASGHHQSQDEPEGVADAEADLMDMS